MYRVFDRFGLRHFSRPAVLVAAIALGLAAGTASASTFTVFQQNPGNYADEAFGDNGYAPVNITSGYTTQAVYAGGFALQGNLSGTGTMENFTAFCLDISHQFTAGTDYSVTNSPFNTSTGGIALSTLQQNNITKLFDVYYTSALVANDAADAGFQLALWEIVNERNASTAGLSLSSGTFKASSYKGWADNVSASPQAIQDAQTYLANFQTATNQNNYTLLYLQSVNTSCKPGCPCTQPSQNLVTISAVPLPATGLLLLTAFGGLGFALRRRRSGQTGSFAAL